MSPPTQNEIATALDRSSKRYQFSSIKRNIMYSLTLQNQWRQRDKYAPKTMSNKWSFWLHNTIQFCAMAFIDVQKYKQQFPMNLIVEIFLVWWWLHQSFTIIQRVSLIISSNAFMAAFILRARRNSLYNHEINLLW